MSTGPVIHTTSKAQDTFNLLMWPLVAYTAMGSLYIYSQKGAIWFTLHPVAMIVAFVGLAANSAMIKRIGGLENTRLHGIMMTVATMLAGFGFYVIYSNKEMGRKKHFTTLHGQLGLFVMVAYIALAFFGAVLLHPDFGIMNRHPGIRFGHKWGGRLVTALSWTSCILGLINMGTKDMVIAVFAVPLAAFGYYVLL